MNIRLKRMRDLCAAISLAAVVVGGMAIAHAEEAGGGQHGMHGAMQHHGSQKGEMHGKDHDGGGKQGAHAKGHRGRHGERQDGHHLFGDHWKQTLSAEQKAQLDRLHLEFAKKKHTLKSGIQALKVQLAVLAIAEQPQAEAIDAQINELLMAKRQLMQAKYQYIAAQRRVLTPEQRVSFDMDVIHKAAGGGKSKGPHGGGKH